MVIVVAADIMYHVMTVIMSAPMYVIVVHRATMLRQNGMSVIASSRAIMEEGAPVLRVLPAQVALEQLVLPVKLVL
jgi:hypothetical protein